MPSGGESSGNICRWVVAYHQMGLRVRYACAFHRMTVQAYIRFVDSDIVAQHHYVNIWHQSGVVQLLELDFLESVAENAYGDPFRPKPFEKLDGSGYERFLPGQEVEVQRVETC